MVIAGVLALLCLGGVGVGIALYDEATAIDRDDPEIVVSELPTRELVDRRRRRREALLLCEQDCRARADPGVPRDDIETASSASASTIVVDLGTRCSVEPAEERSQRDDRDWTQSSSTRERSVQTWQFTVVDDKAAGACARRNGSADYSTHSRCTAPRASWAPARSTPTGTSPARWRRRTQMSPSAFVCTSVTARRSRRSTPSTTWTTRRPVQGVDVDRRHRDPRRRGVERDQPGYHVAMPDRGLGGCPTSPPRPARPAPAARRPRSARPRRGTTPAPGSPARRCGCPARPSRRRAGRRASRAREADDEPPAAQVRRCRRGHRHDRARWPGRPVGLPGERVGHRLAAHPCLRSARLVRRMRRCPAVRRSRA